MCVLPCILVSKAKASRLACRRGSLYRIVRFSVRLTEPRFLHISRRPCRRGGTEVSVAAAASAGHASKGSVWISGFSRGRWAETDRCEGGTRPTLTPRVSLPRIDFSTRAASIRHVFVPLWDYRVWFRMVLKSPNVLKGCCLKLLQPNDSEPVEFAICKFKRCLVRMYVFAEWRFTQPAVWFVCNVLYVLSNHCEFDFIQVCHAYTEKYVCSLEWEGKYLYI